MTLDEIYCEEDYVVASVSLAMNTNASSISDEPRVAYNIVDQDTNPVKYALYSSSSGWIRRHVTSGGGGGLDLALDPLNTSPTAKPRIVCRSGGKLAYCESSNDGINWTTTPDISPHDTANYPSLALDPITGYPKVAYEHGTVTPAVSYICYNGTGWSSPDRVAPDEDYVTCTPAIALDPAVGMPWVLMEHDTVGLIVAYQFSGGHFLSQTWYRITDNSGTDLVLFGSGGDVVITKGDLNETAASGDLNPTAAEEFIIQDSTPDEVARIDDSGDMWIKGQVTDEVGSPSPSDPAMIIKDSSADIQSFIDENGDMELTGFVYEKGVKQNY